MSAAIFFLEMVSLSYMTSLIRKRVVKYYLINSHSWIYSVVTESTVSVIDEGSKVAPQICLERVNPINEAQSEIYVQRQVATKYKNLSFFFWQPSSTALPFLSHVRWSLHVRNASFLFHLVVELFHYLLRSLGVISKFEVWFFTVIRDCFRKKRIAILKTRTLNP